MCKILSSLILFVHVGSFDTKYEIYSIVFAASETAYLFFIYSSDDDDIDGANCLKPWVLKPKSIGLVPVPNTLGSGFSYDMLQSKSEKV